MPNSHLPTRLCEACLREFSWRKKWERDWEHVKFCSRRCASAKRRSAVSRSEDATLPKGKGQGE
ncbi:MAG: DUF2256 domain-containing protein [Planctomycetes bacterium]|nr:DUF2256 domain-containing protein [Planctomycetota bacterium]